MTSDVFVPGDEHRDELVELLRVSYNMSNAALADRAAWMPVTKMRCISEGDRIVAAAGARDFRQWFGGHQLEMSGIWGVVTSPEHRGGGLATRTVVTLLEEARARGQSVSALYPATQRPYRGIGYELGGTMTRHEVPLDDLPSGPPGPLPVEELMMDRDLEGVRACYRASVAGHNGPIDSDEDDWWPDRVLGPWFSQDVQRAVVARGTDGIEGYASFTYGPASGAIDFNYHVVCRHLVASTIEGMASLLSYLRAFRGLGVGLRFTGPPAAPLALLIDEQRVLPVWTYRWMLRLLDVPAALSGRGYAPVSASFDLVVEDGLFPENRGPWRVSVADGVASVEPGGSAGAPSVSIGILSALFSGFLPAWDAASLGLVPRESAPVLASVFGGPAPWMYDFF
jgi:predicted acetyltransferase